MTSAAAVLSVAAGQIGYHEAPDGSNRYGAAYGMDRTAWCNEFTWWCFVQAGAAALTPKSAYTPTTAAWYQARGAADKTPRPGDLVFYNWPGDGVDRIQHVGFVEKVLGPGQIQTIEGNTTQQTGGNQSDGGWVARRVRSTSSVVVYGHPAYDGAPAAPPAAGGDLATLSYGMKNDSRVAAFQRRSNAYPWNPELPVVPPTGNYLDQTKALVAAIQKRAGITGPGSDGSVIGPQTKGYLAPLGFRW